MRHAEDFALIRGRQTDRLRLIHMGGISDQSTLIPARILCTSGEPLYSLQLVFFAIMDKLVFGYDDDAILEISNNIDRGFEVRLF